MIEQEKMEMEILKINLIEDFINNSVNKKDELEISQCCDANIRPLSDICSRCGEHTGIDNY